MESELEQEIESHEETKRRPGEMVFSAFLLIMSLVLLWNAYGIAGFTKLSSPGAIPMAATFVMVIASLIVFLKVIKLPPNTKETIQKDILPIAVVVFMGLLIGYGMLLHPLGFLPATALFLIIGIQYLGRRKFLWTVGISVFCLLLIWLVFRIVFTVLMPSGVVPEAEIIQYFRNMMGG